jgi:hypothetical protein
MAGAGYKLYATGDILTAAQVNNYLQEQTVMVFADAAARTTALASVLSEGMISYLKDTNVTQYYSGSAWVNIGGGGGGKLLQLVSASTTTSTAITTTSMADTSITATITPTLNTSKILVIVSASTATQRSANESRAQAQLLRGATKIADMNTESFFGGQFSGITTFFMQAQNSVTYLDSPATTSATTYKLQGSVNSTGGSQQLTFQLNSSQSTITLMEIGA